MNNEYKFCSKCKYFIDDECYLITERKDKTYYNLSTCIEENVIKQYTGLQLAIEKLQAKHKFKSFVGYTGPKSLKAISADEIISGKVIIITRKLITEILNEFQDCEYFKPKHAVIIKQKIVNAINKIKIFFKNLITNECK